MSPEVKQRMAVIEVISSMKERKRSIENVTRELQSYGLENVYSEDELKKIIADLKTTAREGLFPNLKWHHAVGVSLICLGIFGIYAYFMGMRVNRAILYLLVTGILLTFFPELIEKMIKDLYENK